ncbi:MAG: pyridoxine 5'-phosphate synthase [Chitinivibrionales bacterium]|nr:pyridoxine 5'-phosphate synthase [Chitinivibrionales bacterium]MBD3394719.1 pyridoxine 5'-phosphate synthase [Chitinivibrionales bacterium]
MPTLGVNIDHIATLRQARGGKEPDPLQAAVLAELAGAHGITAHLREDRRHMQDRDIYLLKQTVTTHLNLEMAATSEMVQVAMDVTPHMATLVPEKREERTTEGGLAVRGKERDLEKIIENLHEHNILVSLFVDPDIQQIKAAARSGASHVELHTGYYANASGQAQDDELAKLQDAAIAAHKLGLRVNAGHGLNYRNTSRVADLDHIEELNIGHAIISRAALVGMDLAVRDMLALL